MTDIQYVTNQEKLLTGIILPVDDWEKVQQYLALSNGESAERDLSEIDKSTLKAEVQKIVNQVDRYRLLVKRKSQ